MTEATRLRGIMRDLPDADDEFVESVRRCAWDVSGQARDVTASAVSGILDRAERHLAEDPELGACLRVQRVEIRSKTDVECLSPDRDTLGRFWSLDVADFSTDALWIDHAEDEDAPEWIFTALVPLADVDWPGTVASQHELPWEREVRARAGCTVRLERLEKCAPGSDTPVAGRPRRPDLAGAIFSLAPAPRHDAATRPGAGN